MNIITHTGSGGNVPPTMTSQEIAELVSARHDSVRRTIERLAEKGVIQLPPLVEVKNHLGQTVSVYSFTGERGKRDTYIVVAQLCPEFTAKLVDRWQELEQRNVLNLSDPAQLHSLLLTHLERELALEGQVEEMRPLVQALDRIAQSDGSMCITDAAKALQIRPKTLFAYLRANGWIYSRAGNASEVAYQDKLQAGLLEHKVTTVSRTDGTEKTVTQVRVTPKGLAKLAKGFPPTEPMAAAA